MKNILIYKLSLIFLLFFLSCSDYLEQQPADQVINQNVIKGANDLRATTLGIYDEMQDFSSHLFIYGLLISDEGVGGHAVFTPLNLNQLNGSTLFDNIWRFSYKAIYNATFILEEMEKLDDLSSEQKNAFMGEVKFLRAYCYMLLAQLYGDLPLVTSTDTDVNKALSRTGVNEIYTSFLLPELLEAEQLISASYPTEVETKTRATKAAAQALLVHLYLLLEDWENAESFATKIIENPSYTLESNYEDLFDSQSFSEESIWEIFYSTDDGNSFALAFTLPFYLPTEKIVNAFEDGDLRFNASLTEISPGNYRIIKYKNVSTRDDRPYVFRLADIYLLRAEARTRKGDLVGAVQDINIIRNRAGLADIDLGSMNEVLLAVEQERYIELCFEGSKRWFDLLRTKRADAVMGAFNPDTWDPDIDKLFPIPQRDLDNNPNLTQNPGYD